MENTKVEAKVSDKDVSATEEVSRSSLHTASFFGMGFSLWGLVCFVLGILAGGMLIGYIKAVFGGLW
ncbi:MAG: hypothetical protein OEL66_10300 [Desulfobulbaceae bacterium]|nr:hypothetical protein [Desulfobulbaceae bacterium]